MYCPVHHPPTYVTVVCQRLGLREWFLGALIMWRVLGHFNPPEPISLQAESQPWSSNYALAGDLRRWGHSPGRAVLTLPAHASLTRQLKLFTGATWSRLLRDLGDSWGPELPVHPKIHGARLQRYYLYPEASMFKYIYTYFITDRQGTAIKHFI